MVLCDQIVELPNLKEIYLQKNEISNKGAYEVANKLLSKCNSLRLIDLSCNKIGRGGVTEIVAKSIAYKHLIEIYLLNNNCSFNEEELHCLNSRASIFI